MDVLSHGLWGGVTVGRSSRKSYWTAFAFGVAPDVIAFGPFFGDRLLLHGAEFFEQIARKPDPTLIPAYVHTLYHYTHSLVIFAAAFIIVWIARRKPMMEMLAWGLHICMDIFTHNSAFFPTPFLFPISDWHFDGIPWSSPIIFFPNLAVLAVLYGWYFYRKARPKLPRDPLA